MKTSLNGLAELVGHEAIVLKPYRDSKGIWTIGVGHTAAAGAPDPKGASPLSLEEALALFARDIARYEADVNRAVKVPVEQHEFDALVSFHYNTGAISTATLVKSLNEGKRELAAAQFMNWITPIEIKGRRQRERDLFATGRYGDGMANLYPNGLTGKPVRVDARAALGVKSEDTNLRRGLKNSDPVRDVQRRLAALGLYAGAIDGDFGPGTEKAVEQFQRGWMIPPTIGVVDARTLKILNNEA